MSIATERGDFGETSLPGGARVSKGDPRVDAYGTIDELISALGLARALCPDAEIREFTKSIQRELFKVGSVLAGRPTVSRGEPVLIEDAMVDRLTGEVHRIESTDGMLADWSLPGEDAGSAAFDVARSVCRRAERLAVKIAGEGTLDPNVLRYLNRLSDLIWLFSRQIELAQNVDSRLRTNSGPRWSRAW
jgi:cob(I)alamin adenosyltransferase